MSDDVHRRQPTNEAVAYGLLMLFANEPWFQDAMTRADQAVKLFEEHDIVGRLALSQGFLQVGVPLAEKRRERPHPVIEPTWLEDLAMRCLQHGAKVPYDHTRSDQRPVAQDWAHGAARGIVAALCMERQLEPVLEHFSERIRINIVEKIAAIIRRADAVRRDAGEWNTLLNE